MKNKKTSTKALSSKSLCSEGFKNWALKEQHDVKVVIMTAPSHATSVNRNDYKIAAANYAEVAN